MLDGQEPARSDIVTIIDVARHAGVAPSTVSYVLSGKRTISAATKQRVLNSIRTLGYHPHAASRTASTRASAVALTLPLRAGMHLPVVMRCVTSVVTTARRHDLDVLVVTSDEGAAGIRRVAATPLVGGLIVMDVELRDCRVPLLRELDRPSVLIGFPAQSAGLTCVDLDFFRAAALCVQRLADLGHREVTLIGPPRAVYERGTGFAHRVLAGFREAATRRGLRAGIVPCEDAYETVRRQLVHLFAERPAVTGLVVHNEGAVTHVLRALSSLGRTVPDDVSVIAIGPDEVAELATPPLDSVLVPTDELGTRAVELLIGKMSGSRVSEANLISPRLTRRGSAVRAPVRPAVRPAAPARAPAATLTRATG
jgi:LacI family transcriptional regulator